MSNKSLAQKLGIKSGHLVWISDATKAPMIGELPEGAVFTSELTGASAGIAFLENAEAVRALVAASGDALPLLSPFFAAYPKGNKTDINRDTLWPLLTPSGIRPNGQFALDDVWSALRFRANKPGEGPFLGGSA